MPKCLLHIELESGSTYAPGELITGAVVVEVLEQCHCEKLSLSWGWKAHGRGDSDADPPEWLLALSEQEEWLPGQKLRYPFRLEAPNSPFTHHGHVLSVDWSLRTEAHLSGFQKTRAHAEQPFSLVLAETKEPASTTIGLSTPRKLEVEAPKHDTGGKAIIFTLFQLLMAAYVLKDHPKIIGLLVFLFLLFAAWRWDPGNSVRSHTLGTLWLSSELVAPGELVGLRIQLQPERGVHVHHFSVSLECVEAATSRTSEGPDITHEHSLHKETILEWTSAALNRGEPLESPILKVAIPRDGSTSFKFKNNELRWFLRLEARLEGDKKVFFQLVPLQVQPHYRPTPQDAGERRQALKASSTHDAKQAPWLQVKPLREKKRPCPLPSVDARRKLEGGVEVLEAAHVHYTALLEALQESQWKLHLRPRLETLRKARHQEPALLEALDRLHQRARAEGWSETEPALALAREVEGLRVRVGGLASSRLGNAGSEETLLLGAFERLERSVVQTLPPPLASGEKVLCTGGFSASPLLPGLALIGVCFTHCVAESPSGLAGPVTSWDWLWVAWMVLSAVCIWSQYRCSGRFWLTEERLIWLPTRGDPLQISLRDIPPGGTRLHHLEGVEVRTLDGRTIHLKYLSRERVLVDRLKR